MPQLKRVCKNIDPHQCSMSNTSTAARQKCVESLLKMQCDLTVVRDEDMHACSGDVLDVGGHNVAFGEAMILPVSLFKKNDSACLSASTALEPSHDCCASFSV